jgi:Ohr subfamily peroxiredoxin
MTTAVYTATATSWGGRTGKVVTSDDKIAMDLSIPAEMGGDGGAGTNPEQLFASGWAACFHSAVKMIARSQKLDVTDSAVTLSVGVIPGEGGGFDFDVKIEVQIPGADRVAAQAVVDAAHQVCPYSRATRGNLPVAITLITEED